MSWSVTGGGRYAGNDVRQWVGEVVDTIRRVTGGDFWRSTRTRRRGDTPEIARSVAHLGDQLTAASRRPQNPEHPRPAAVGDERPARIVVFSASVGAGHAGATEELARRLRERGFLVDCLDVLAVLSPGVRKALSDDYRRILSSAPWVYGVLFAIAQSLRGAAPVTRVLLRPVRPRLLRLLPSDTRAVVSAYPLASQILGPLRRNGQLTVPAITYLTDFGVHPIWIAPGVDAHCAVHEVTQTRAYALGGADVRVAGRLVSAGFKPGSPSAKRRAREQFGLPPDGRLALLVAGSWAVGDLAAAAADVAATGVAVPVVVCAENEVLYRRLQRQGAGHVLGWVHDMPTLMHAVDVLVENAGGLTALEGMACGLPVVTYRPIPGHGKANAATMAAAEVASWVRRHDTLGATLIDVIEGTRGLRQRDAGLSLFESDPAAVVADIAKSVEPPTPTARAE